MAKGNLGRSNGGGAVVFPSYEKEKIPSRPSKKRKLSEKTQRSGDKFKRAKPQGSKPTDGRRDFLVEGGKQLLLGRSAIVKRLWLNASPAKKVILSSKKAIMEEHAWSVVAKEASK